MNLPRCLPVLLIAIGSTMAAAQQRFELVVPGSGLVSRAERSGRSLRVVDAEGQETVYTRDPRFDTADGSYLGFWSDAARQIIRWPAADRGRMQIAADTARPVFRASQMEIRPLGPAAGGVLLSEIDPGTAYRLVSTVPGDRARTLSVDHRGSLILSDAGEDDQGAWHLTSVAPPLFRLHSDARGRSWSLAAGPDKLPRLARTGSSLDQLWQLVEVPGVPDQVVLAQLDGGRRPRVLACGPGGRVVLSPRDWSASQRWTLVRIGPRLPPVFGEYRFISREIRPHAPLPPARLELSNRHNKELWILLVDRRQADGPRRLRLPAGQSLTLSLERDAGATLVEVYERGRPDGVVQRDEFVSMVPPAVRYDLSVYELIVQSVAIDRTVPGGKLEDVQQAPRSIGWFELPPGQQLEDGTLDVFGTAESQQNPGQVRRIDPAQWRAAASKSDPVESLLEKFQQK